MEYWEFLLQKEGDRTWQPIKSNRLQIEEGRYRVVAHSSRTNTDVEICVIYDSTEEVPPKRRSQKRSRRTNPEGLMVVIPFTYLKPGLWQLRCCGDILSDFLGNSWQHAAQLQVLAKVKNASPITEPQSPATETPQTDVQADFSDPLLSTPDIPVEPISTPNPTPQPISLSEVPTEDSSEAEVQPVSLSEPSVPLDAVEAFYVPLNDDGDSAVESSGLIIDGHEQDMAIDAPAALSIMNNEPSRDSDAYAPEENGDSSALSIESDETQHAVTDDSTEVVTPANPLLDQSLQMLEQILQQVLDPVMQELEPSEPAEVQSMPEAELLSQSDSTGQGFILTLDEESLGTHRGEVLTISGQVDVLDIHQLSGSESFSDRNPIFRGFLRYELRDPQTSRILLDVQQPLSEQVLPLSFSHTLEIPSDCPTRLILGKVTLYDGRCLSDGSTSVALASQPFSVTADLDELLGAIIPATRTMPVAKVIPPHASASYESQGDSPELPPPPLKHPLLDLNTNQLHQSLSLKPSTGQTLPPQIYQPAPTSSRSKKSLQLPKLPKLKPITESIDFSQEQAFSQQLASVTPVVTTSEPAEIEAKLENEMESLQPLLPADIPALGISTSVPFDTTQKKGQSSEDTTSPDVVQGTDSLSSAVKEADGSNPPVPAVDSQLDSVTTGETLSDIREIEELLDVADTNSEESNGATLQATEPNNDNSISARSQLSLRETQLPSDALEMHQGGKLTVGVSEVSELDVYSTVESGLGESQEPDTIEITSSDSALNGSDTTKIQPTVVSRFTEVVADEAAGVEDAFQSLDLQNRFWARLNSLATDSELSQSLNSDVSPSSSPVNGDVSQPSELNSVGLDVEEVTQPLTFNTLLEDFDQVSWDSENDDFVSPSADSQKQLQPPPLEQKASPEEEISEQLPLADVADIDWFDQEFVVDDEEELAVPEPSVASPEQSVVKQEVPETISPTTPPKASVPSRHPKPEIPSIRQFEPPLPTPELSIPSRELAAGEPVIVRVKLPPHSSRLCVKLWAQDRQSRSILDGPRWLMDLIPDRSGEQEALTQLTVPFGSVDIRFEAIAVDIDTQRESHKVAIDCVVVPPDLPDISLDDFQAEL